MLIRVQRLNSSCGKFVQSFRVVSKSPLNLNLSVDNMNHFLEALSNWNSLVDKEKGLKQRYSVSDLPVTTRHFVVVLFLSRSKLSFSRK